MSGGTDPRACAVCGRVLDYFRDRGWMHSLAAPAEDHVAVPVPVDQVEVRGRCDFCFEDGPSWIVPARDFVITPSRSVGDWAACDGCAQLIEGNRWNALEKRCVASWETRHGPMGDVQQAGIRRLHRELRKNIMGSLRPIGS